MNENTNDVALGIVLRAFQLIFDNSLKREKKEPILEKLKPEELMALFKLTATSDSNTMIRNLRDINRTVTPRYPECSRSAYTNASNAARDYALFYKSCFD